MEVSRLPAALVPAGPPSRAALHVLTERVALREMTWLRKRGYAKDDDASNDTPERSFAEVLVDVATQRGTLETQLPVNQGKNWSEFPGLTT